MADNKISDLPSNAALDDADLIEIEQPGQTAGTRSRKTTLATLLAWVQSGLTGLVASVNGATGAVVLPGFAQVMLSDMTTDLTTGAAKAVWFAPEDGQLSDVWLALHDPSSSGIVRIDMNDSGGSVFTTRPAIDATEATSLTGTAAVLDGTITFSKGDKFTFDIDDAGTDAKGLQVTVEYLPT